MNLLARWVTPSAWRGRRISAFLFLLSGLLAPTEAASARSVQTAGASSQTVAAEDDGAPTARLLQQKLEELEASRQIEASTQRLADLYRTALGHLEEAEAHDATTSGFTEALEMAPQQIREIRERLAAAENVTEDSLGLPSTVTLRDLEQLLVRLTVEIQALETELSSLTSSQDSVYVRLAAARERLAAARQELDAVEGELAGELMEDDRPELAEARRWERQSHVLALRSEVRMLEQELASHGVRVELLLARRDEASLSLERSKTRHRSLEAEIKARRLEQAESIQEEVERTLNEVSTGHPLVRELAEENTQLAGTMVEDATLLGTMPNVLAVVEQARNYIETKLRGARLRMEAVGMSPELGQYLLENPREPEDLWQLRRARQRAEQTHAEKTLAQLRHREELNALDDLDAWMDERSAELAEDQARLVREALEPLARRRVELLDQAIELQDLVLQSIGDATFTARELEETADRYDAFVSEHLLWVRTAGPIDRETRRQTKEALEWLVAPEHLQETGALLGHDARRAPWFWLPLAAALLLLAGAHRIRRSIRKCAEPLHHVHTDAFHYTLEATGWTALLALPLPLLLGTIGWRMNASPEATVYSTTVGTAFLEGAVALFALLFFSVLAMSEGVADRHFGWPQESLSLVRRVFGWAGATLVPLGIIASAMFYHPNPLFAMSLNRLALTALLIGISVSLAILLHPRHGALKGFLAERPDGWAGRTRWLWYALALFVPVGLLGITLVGYVYTAGVLVRLLIDMLWLGLGLVMLHQLIARWLVVTRRHLALQATLERRAARQAEQAAAPAGEETSSESLRVEEPEIDFKSLGAETRKVMNAAIFLAALVGQWFIWSDVIGAFSVLDSWILWYQEAAVDGVAQLVPVTLGDLVVVLFIVIMGVFAARHLPAVLEILLLEQGSLSSGARYALIKLVRYAIVTVVVLAAFGALGFRWSQVHWLVAALGVGIGFGLQEIVANFISGLIVLFERPIRVGDIVTVGDTTGIVTKINIRATMIRNWDHQELLVPNKEFITTRLLNWTLSDPINRLTIVVGVAYGSDVEEAMRLLRQAAESHERVLSDPAPRVTFESFGENALRLILHCHLASLEGRHGVLSELHETIHRLFREAGIAIPFPQRDVHFYMSEPLRVSLEESKPKDRKRGKP